MTAARLDAAAATLRPAGDRARRLATGVGNVVGPVVRVLWRAVGPVLRTVTVAGWIVIGLAVLALVLRAKSKPGIALVVGATSVILLGFTLMGHTASHSPRWLLVPLLLAHLLVVAFWFGALVPLRLAAMFEAPRTAGAAIEAFSTAATWIVPALLVAGVALAAVLLGDFAALSTAYGQSLIIKFVGFALLMGLAALNKWRLGPGVTSGDTGLTRNFQRSLQVEYVLIAAVLTVTAVMTTFFSPD